MSCNTSMHACPKCGNPNTYVERRPDGFCYCPDCQHRWKIGESQRKPTLFDHITVSVEVLSEEFVEPYTRWREDRYLETLWRSNFRELSGMLFDTKEEAIASTVAKLKEVYNETTSN